MRAIVGLLAAATICLTTAKAADRPAPKRADEPSDWRRTPVVAAPLLAAPPAIDGTVGAAEWSAAAALGPLKLLPEGAADELDRQAWVGYDAARLYLAFRFGRPPLAQAPPTPGESGRVDNWKAGDSVQIALDPDRSAASYYGFALYANGAYAEGIGKPSMYPLWNADWQRAARTIPGGWEGEMAIPFASLGAATPAPGDRWGFDLADIWQSPRQIAQWAFRGKSQKELQLLGELRFAGPAPAVRFLSAGEVGNQQGLVDFEIVNPSDRPAEVQAEVEVFRRKPGPAGGAYSFYANIESGGDESYAAGQTDFYKGADLARLIADTLRQYEPIAGGSRSGAIAVPGGQRRSCSVLHAGGPGEYLAIYQFRTADGPPLAAGALPFEISAPLALTVQPYWLNAQRLVVRADLRKIDVPGGAAIEFSVGPAAAGAPPLVTQRVAVPGDRNRPAEATLATEGLAAGFYRIRAAVLSAQGESLAENETTVEKPATPPWHGNQFGKRLAVSKPWTPVVAEPDGRVSVWGRRYDLSRLLPASITSQGQAILPEPVALDLVAAGRPQAWQVTSFALHEATPGRAVYKARLESDSAVLAGEVWVEFDGLAWYDLELSGKGGPLAVDRLRLNVPFAQVHARLVDHHRFLDDPLLRVAPPGGPSRSAAGEGESASAGPLVPGAFGGRAMPFTPYLWLGDERAGLAFICEGPERWENASLDRVMEVLPVGEAPHPLMRINIVDRPAVFRRPLGLRFGLMASPYRPLPPAGTDCVVQAGGSQLDPADFRQAVAAGATTAVFHSGWKGPKGTEPLSWSGWPTEPPRPEHRQQLAQAVETAHAAGLRVLLYTGWGVDQASDEYRQFGAEMLRMPIENSGFGTYRQSAGLHGSYADYMAWAHATLIGKYGYDGVFWDSASNLQPDANLQIGNGWVDDQGGVHPTFPVLATRELFRRLYNLVHGELKDGGAVVNFGGAVWPVNIYADVFHRGEGAPMEAASLKTAFESLESYRAGYDAEKYGVPYLAMNKNFKRLPMTVNHLLTINLLHGDHAKANFGHLDGSYQNYSDRGEPLAAVWQAKRWLPLDQNTKRFCYYDRPAAIGVQPTSLLASVFVSADGRRALVVAANLETAPSAARVSLDPAALGMTPGKLRMEDALLKTPLLLDGGAIPLDIEAERYRLVKLWIE